MLGFIAHHAVVAQGRRMEMIEQAVILAGGRGERLRPLTDEVPKPMAPVNGVPFTDYLLRSLVDAGIKRVLFLVGYKAEKIMAYYGDCLTSGIQVEYSVGTEHDLTGRRLLNAYGQLSDRFLLLYGDNYWPMPLARMIGNYERLGTPVTTTVFSNKNGTGEYGRENNVIVDASGMVKAYDKSRRAQGLNGIDIGFFIVDKSVLDMSDTENSSFEEKTLPRLAAERRLGAFVTDEQYYFITSIETLRQFEAVALVKRFTRLEKKGTG